VIMPILSESASHSPSVLADILVFCVIVSLCSCISMSDEWLLLLCLELFSYFPHYGLRFSVQCFDAVGWVTGRASGL